MSLKDEFKLILILVFITAIAVPMYNFSLSSVQNQNKVMGSVSPHSFGWKFPEVFSAPKLSLYDILASIFLAYSKLRDPVVVPEGLPVRLKIPIIGVDSVIEDALITPDGKMDMPYGSTNVAWFALGPKPGEMGSAVIGGHFGIRDGVKFVFYDLNKLIVGDKIYIENDKGETLAFQVRRIELFDQNADATNVFISKDGLAHLNLITCEGIWNRVNDSYPKRRVVFTDMVSTIEVAPTVTSPTSISTITKAQDLATFYRTLRVGSKGADVVALQNYLKQLGIYSGAVDGSFGKLTRNAVVKYQASALLFPNGIFDPFTRDKLIVELGGDTGLPTAGAESPVDEIDTSTPIPNILNEKPPIALYVVVLLISIFSIIFLGFKVAKKE